MKPTWADLYRDLWKAGFQRDEYFSFGRYDNRDKYYLQPVWDGPKAICYWVIGGSEGFYVHVDVITETGLENIMLGKFWDQARAEEAVIWITRRINGCERISLRSEIFEEKYPMHNHIWYRAANKQYLMAKVHNHPSKSDLYPVVLYKPDTIRDSESSNDIAYILECASEEKARRYAWTWAKLFSIPAY